VVGDMMRKFLICTLVLLLSEFAHAQVLLPQRPVSHGAVSLADMTRRLELTAIRALSGPRAPLRGSAIDFAWASSPEEHRALAKHVVVLVSVVTKDAAELPLRRVYISANGQETELVRLSSQLSGVREGSTTFSVLGPYREDGFYLAPAGRMMADGYLQADFAMRRNGFNLYKLPGASPDFIKADSDRMPAMDAKPDPSALKALLHREYKGFDLPASLR
jgi:hypothetical protein